MKFMQLIYQGTSPTPRPPEAWATLSEAGSANASSVSMANFASSEPSTPARMGAGVRLPGGSCATRTELGDEWMMRMLTLPRRSRPSHLGDLRDDLNGGISRRRPIGSPQDPHRRIATHRPSGGTVLASGSGAAGCRPGCRGCWKRGGPEGPSGRSLNQPVDPSEPPSPSHSGCRGTRAGRSFFSGSFASGAQASVERKV